MAGNDLVQSVVRSMEILQTVAESAAGMKLNDISARLSLGSSTTHNLLRSLASRGFITRSSGGRYHLGDEIPRLAGLYAGRSLTRTLGAALLLAARELPDAVLTWAELSGGEIAVRLRVSPDSPDRVEQPAGRTFNPYSNATGLLFLACLPEEERLSLMQIHSFYEEGAHLFKDLQGLDTQLKEIRGQGVSILPFEEPFVRIALPVWRSPGELCGGLGACLPVKGDRQEAITRVNNVFRGIIDHLAKNL